ncbi:hypothetical protein ASD38_10390 [Caulobacter sp. Root487D2Y]|uniref:hypothetical protein n=1 Tax=Caulobacter sp. Root487D2Y TaxID=1736547 RepID=UPI0006F69DF8|nr:hypothetical protein [Caulobacter sp. Root487D2Y]KQY29724.1 hypothetical protein ASD38_10390 [Caulobacter sp. Root487D2Y]
MNRTATLIAALEPLALAPDEQLAYLAALGVGETADELALQFDDAFRYAHPMGQASLDAALRALNERLSMMSDTGKAALWSPLALAQGEDWVFIRRTAARALELTRALDDARV